MKVQFSKHRLIELVAQEFIDQRLYPDYWGEIRKQSKAREDAMLYIPTVDRKSLENYFYSRHHCAGPMINHDEFICGLCSIRVKSPK